MEIVVKKQILNWSSKRTVRKGDVPAEILNNCINAYLSKLTILINDCLKKEGFPNDLKLTDRTPIFKTKDK